MAPDGAMGWARDTELVLAARAGDPEAFGRLFDAWFPSVYDIAYRIVRQREAAADVAQDTFLAAWQGLAGLDQPGSFGGWLRRIARNRALNRLAADRRAVVDDDEVAAVLDSPGSQSRSDEWSDADMTADLTRAEQHQMVWSAAGTLGPRDASLLDLHLRHGLGAGGRSRSSWGSPPTTPTSCCTGCGARWRRRPVHGCCGARAAAAARSSTRPSGTGSSPSSAPPPSARSPGT